MDEKNEKKQPMSKKKTTLIIVNVVLALVLLILVLVTAYVESRLGLINRNDPANDGTLSSSEIDDILNATDETDEGFTGPIINPDDVDWGTEPSQPVVVNEEVVNILLIGQDRREGEGRSRSDAMILCTINTGMKTLTLTSFMRDMYIQIPGYQDNRINVCYALGGMSLLDDALLKNFGIQVDGNVEVDFNGFMDVVDLLGGVDITLTSAEASYLNRRGNWEVTSNDNWSLTEGVNHLNGSQALAYSRIRAVGGDGDFGRTNRQRNVLNALIEKAKGLSLLELDGLLTQILPMITTDLSNAEILNYTTMLLPLLADLNVQTLRIPADGAYSYASIRDMSVLLPDLAKNRELLEAAMVGQNVE